MSKTNEEPFIKNFENWQKTQHLDLTELIDCLSTNPQNQQHLRSLVDKGTSHFQDYVNSREELAKVSAPTLLCPSWCSNFERSHLWIGGCRPTLIFRLLYSLVGTKLEQQLDEILQGESKDNLGNIRASQLEAFNKLHSKTLEEEEFLSSKLATMQEDIADQPLVQMANQSVRIGEPSEEVEKAMEGHSVCLKEVFVEADRLRMKTLKDLIELLTPAQAVDLLIASKKLHLSIHEWALLRAFQSSQQVIIGMIRNMMFAFFPFPDLRHHDLRRVSKLPCTCRLRPRRCPAAEFCRLTGAYYATSSKQTLRFYLAGTLLIIDQLSRAFFIMADKFHDAGVDSIREVSNSLHV